MEIPPFDNRDGFIWMNGKFIPWNDAKCHVITQGLHYASSVFEGERAYKGKIFKSKEHKPCDAPTPIEKIFLIAAQVSMPITSSDVKI